MGSICGLTDQYMKENGLTTKFVVTEYSNKKVASRVTMVNGRMVRNMDLESISLRMAKYIQVSFRRTKNKALEFTTGSTVDDMKAGGSATNNMA